MDPVTTARLDLDRRAGREHFRARLCERRVCAQCSQVFLSLTAAPKDAPCFGCSTRATSPRVDRTHAAATHSED